MMTLPLADARAQLSKLVDEASTTHERIVITKNGRRAAVLLGVDDFDALRETLAVLSDPKLLLAHQEGVRALVHGDSLTSVELAGRLRSALRGVDAT